MAFKIICNDCKAPLDEASKIIMIPEITFIENGQPPRTARNIHLCDKKCATSFIVKTSEAPSIITAN